MSKLLLRLKIMIFLRRKSKKDMMLLFRMVKFDEDKSKKKLGALLKQEEEDLARVLSYKYGLEYLDLSRTAINTDALRLLPEKDARKAEIAPFDSVGKKLKVAIRSPQNERAKKILDDLKTKGYELEVFMVSTGSLERAFSRYKDLSFASEVKAGMLDVSNEEIAEFTKEVQGLADVQTLIAETLTMKKSYRISRILEIILAGGLAMHASDIHLEPEEAEVRLRYRLDGVLTDILPFDRDTFALLLSRIKLLSRLKLNLKTSPQDGRFSIRMSENDIEIRTSLLPGAYSESVVLRILNPQAISVSVDQLGLSPKLFAVLEKEISKPTGMIITTGPTGSGKTTTLYAFLKRVHKPEIKIITIEDPVEYHLPGIVQTQVDHKEYTFPLGLRSALRQDPDVIMVGEIRDGETAKTAIDAALTGHLVFSTLHTNSAAGAFPRLIDLGVDPKVIGSAINVSMAQRLVRILCRQCAKTVPLSSEKKKRIEAILEPVRGEISVQTENEFLPGACKECGGLGFRGRIGIFEAVLVTEEISHMIAASAAERDISEVAKQQRIFSMLQDGTVKALGGVTSFEELSRVIDTSGL